MKIKKKYIVIIGAGIEAVQIYKEAKKLKLLIVGIDKNPNAIALRLADEKIICSTRDHDKTLKELIKFSKKSELIGVMTSATDVPLTVATVASHFKLNSINVQNAKISSNKKLMKKFFSKNKISSSRYFLYKNKKDFKKLSQLSMPYIVKPIDGRGSRGVTINFKKSNFNWALKNAKSHSKFEEVLVEEYEHGKQLSVESFVYKKKYYPIAFADRDYSNLETTKPYIIERGGNTPSTLKSDEKNKINKICSKIVKSLKLNSGSIKFDVVVNKSKVKIIEFTLRLSGGFWSSDIIPKAYGVNLLKLTILNALGKKIFKKDLLPKRKFYVINRYIFPRKKGIYQGIKSEPKSKSLLYFKKLIKNNSLIKLVTTHHAERLVTFACYGKSLKAVQKKVDDIEKNLNIKIN